VNKPIETRNVIIEIELKKESRVPLITLEKKLNVGCRSWLLPGGKRESKPKKMKL
jgi:hypothetical protein